MNTQVKLLHSLLKIYLYIFIIYFYYKVSLNTSFYNIKKVKLKKIVYVNNMYTEVKLELTLAHLAVVEER